MSKASYKEKEHSTELMFLPLKPLLALKSNHYYVNKRDEEDNQWLEGSVTELQSSSPQDKFMPWVSHS